MAHGQQAAPVRAGRGSRHSRWRRPCGRIESNCWPAGVAGEIRCMEDMND
jgi:hypothetical protein